MNRPIPGLVALAFAVLACGSSGCAGVAQSLGFAPPQHRLTDQTRQVLQSTPSPAPLPKELAKALLPEYVVEPGDTLLVVPVDLDSPVRLPGDQTILQDGTIELGVYGRPVVAGKTVAVIEQELNKRIEAYYQKQKLPPGENFADLHLAVTVRLVGRVSKVFYVLGEVNSPGAYPLSGRETVLDGIIAGGGITSRASTDKILLSRPTPPDGCRITLPICYDNIVQLGDTSTNYQLMPGDRIFVGSSGLLDGLKEFNKKACRACGLASVPCDHGFTAGCVSGNCRHAAEPLRTPLSEALPAPATVTSGKPNLVIPSVVAPAP